MLKTLRRAREVYQKDGLLHLLNRGYNHYIKRKCGSFYNNFIRSRLSKGGEYPKYNNVTIVVDKHKRHFLDDFVPFDVPSSADRPDYEEPLVNALRNCINPGDDVVIVGGGYGVTTVYAADKTGEKGSVTVYEAIDFRTDVIKKTVQRNGVNDRCTVIHGIVGPAINPGGGLPSGGTTKAAKHLEPDDIPQCDVLELDCEGAEVEILRNLTIRPHTIIVETHGHRGAPENKVRTELQELGYSVVQRAVEVEENGVFVLTAKRSEVKK